MTDGIRLTPEQRVFLDVLMQEYVKDGRWDDALVMWAYSKGFEAGLHHASVRVAAQAVAVEHYIAQRDRAMNALIDATYGKEEEDD